MSRIEPLPDGQAPPEAEEVFNRIRENGASIINLYRTLSYNPSVMRDWIRLGNSLLTKTELPARLRELAVLRIARLTGSEYEWTQHYSVALEAGVSPQQTRAIFNWESSQDFSEAERAVLRYTDEVAQNAKAQDGTYLALRQHLGSRSIVELTVSIGYWGMVGRFLTALQVDADARPVGSGGELFGGRKDAT